MRKFIALLLVAAFGAVSVNAIAADKAPEKAAKGKADEKGKK